MFTATVDLPTPPLPDATATMFRTPGSGFSPCWTACATIALSTTTASGAPARSGAQ